MPGFWDQFGTPLIGFTGVLVGATLTWAKEFWRDASQKRSSAQYLAIRTVCVFDDFIDKCASVAGDNGRPDASGYDRPEVARPNLQLPQDVDWKSINHEMAYLILSLVNRIENDNEAISYQNEWSSPRTMLNFLKSASTATPLGNRHIQIG